MRRIGAMGGWVLLLIMSSGCALNRNLAISHTYTVGQAQTLSPHNLVYRAHIEAGFYIEPYDTLVIHTVDVSHLTQHQELAGEIGEEFRMELRRRLESVLSGKRVVFSDAPTTSPTTLHLRFAVTEFSPGSGLLRWTFGLGWGAAMLQVEGRGEASGHNRPVFEFARKKSFDGYPMGGLNVTVMDNESTLKQSAQELAKDVASFIASL